MKKFHSLALACLTLFSLMSCNDDDNNNGNNGSAVQVEFKNHSITPNFLSLKSGFSNVEIYSVLSSEDTYLQNFVYGSMADGAGLLKNMDGTYTLINNIEADRSIARITFDRSFKPVLGEYILNADATTETAQCSGSLITPEEHGFGPWYLSGGEWAGSSPGVFITDPYKDANQAGFATLIPAMGQWTTENAVALGKEAYPNKTVVLIGDDDSANQAPMEGQLAMYVGDFGDLTSGKLYGLKVNGIDNQTSFEADMTVGTNYQVEFVEYEGDKTKDALQAESIEKGIMGFQRVEDIDWRRGNPREVYFVATGRGSAEGIGTKYGRVYKLVLDANNPLAGTLSIAVDGDDPNSPMLSPDNITVTENYAYIQEDPNFGADEKGHYAQLYQYNLNTGEMKTVLECNQDLAAATNDLQGFPYSNGDTWELTGMIDISDIIGEDNTFILITQNHGWGEDDTHPGFLDPNAGTPDQTDDEGSHMYIVRGLDR
ncbi:MAG: phosphatase [Winogradskyella sp.]|uniref:phosphatase n=1 Tax=Winogradskyella sp. TaxID=1883156 RepID=UPI0025F974B0|nr:phosphatase [Winogradskyella sp.]NRB59974.1 phosphatase [Winogradskyella sp.]